MKLRSLLLFLVIMAGVGNAFAQTDGENQKQSEIDSGFEWLSLQDAQLQAQQSGKKILLFGYAEWCGYCRKTRRETFPDSTVLAAIEQYYHPVQLDTESMDEITYNGQSLKKAELAQYLRITSYPTHFFISSQGEILGAQPGFLEPEIYTPLLNFVGSDAYQNQTFDEYFESLEEGEKE